VHTLQLKKTCLQQAILQRDEQIMQLKDVTGNVVFGAVLVLPPHSSYTL